jgi:hypothetical protein
MLGLAAVGMTRPSYFTSETMMAPIAPSAATIVARFHQMRLPTLPRGA